MESQLAIQCLPLVERSRAETWGMVDAAIKVIEESGLEFMVGPMETVVHGPLDQLLEVAKKAHLAVMEAGSGKVMSYIKLITAESLAPFEEKISKYAKAGD